MWNKFKMHSVEVTKQLKMMTYYLFYFIKSPQTILKFYIIMCNNFNWHSLELTNN